MTAKRFRPIKTPLGFVRGRDGIYLDDVILEDRTNTLVLVGAFNTALCSDVDDEVIDFDGVMIRFFGVLAIQIIELDSWDWNSESCFDEIIDSAWVRQLGGKVTEMHHHYRVQTYDDVVDVVCDSYEITMTSSKYTEQGSGGNR